MKYEIARAIVDERGLLAVHINGLKHHQRQAPDLRGYNPLHLMGIYHSPEGRYYIYEYKNVTIRYWDSPIGSGGHMKTSKVPSTCPDTFLQLIKERCAISSVHL